MVQYNFCLELYKLSKNSQKETQDICGHFYACDVILFPNYQLISRQISIQVARGHKTIGSNLKLFIDFIHNYRLPSIFLLFKGFCYLNCLLFVNLTFFLSLKFLKCSFPFSNILLGDLGLPFSSLTK